MSVAPQHNQACIRPSGTIEIDYTHLATLGLTPREREVMQWLCEGKRDREIAIILGLSSRTIEKHVGHIFEKLDVETRTAAASQCRYRVALSSMAHALVDRDTDRPSRPRRPAVRSH